MRYSLGHGLGDGGGGGGVARQEELVAVSLHARGAGAGSTSAAVEGGDQGTFASSVLVLRLWKGDAQRAHVEADLTKLKVDPVRRVVSLGACVGSGPRWRSSRRTITPPSRRCRLVPTHSPSAPTALAQRPPPPSSTRSPAPSPASPRP